MTKNEMIDEVIYEMHGELTREQLDRLKITMLVKMQNFVVTEMVTLPSVITHDNEWLLKRYTIDAVAKGFKMSTIEQYVKAVQRLLDEKGKNYRQLTGQDITDYLAERQVRDHIGATYKYNLCQMFFAFFRWAYRRRHIPEDIMRDVDRVKRTRKRLVRLSDEEIEEIRDTCATQMEKALLELMLSTGMRIGEIVALDVNDIDLAQKRVSVYGEKTSQYRTGLLTTKAASALRKYTKGRTDGPLFIHETGSFKGKRIGVKSIEDTAKGMAKRAGITWVSPTVHTYRKTFASIAYKKTKDVMYVAKLLGHADINVTIKYYLVDDLDDMQHVYNTAIN